MVFKNVENRLDFGIVITEGSGRITRSLEKPAWGQVFFDTVNTGIYLLETSVMAQGQLLGREVRIRRRSGV